MVFEIGITKPLTPDGQCGWNKFGALMVFERDGDCINGHEIHDVRESICRICLRGWKLTTESMADQYENQYDEYVHMSCYVRYLTLQDRDLFYSALIGGRIRFKALTEMPSQYWLRDKIWSARNWYQTTTLDQPIMITMGKRKKVYSIKFEPLEGAFSNTISESAEMEFTKEDVTKEFGPHVILIHAWNDDKCCDYVRRLSNVFGLDKRAEVLKT